MEISIYSEIIIVSTACISVLSILWASIVYILEAQLNNNKWTKND